MFTESSAGGNIEFPTYLDNPQYRLVISPALKERSTFLAIRAASQNPTLALNITLIRSRGERIDEVIPGDMVMKSGNYSYGLTEATENDVDIGTYTLIVSSFDRKPGNEISISVTSESPIKLALLPAEGAGMFKRVLSGAWSDTTAVGRPAAGRYEQNPKFELLVPNPTRVL